MLGGLRCFVALVTALLAVAFAQETGAFDLLMPDGTPVRHIVIAPDAPDSVAFAATELQDKLVRRIGRTLELHKDGALQADPAIYLGFSKTTESMGVALPEGFPTDAFAIKTLKNGIVIYGRDYSGPPIVGLRDPWHKEAVWNPKLKLQLFGECSTLNGMHYFLQNYLGFRWYMPGDIGEVIPEADNVTLPEIAQTCAPSFIYRYPYCTFFNSSNDGTLWLKHLRFGGPAPLQINHSFKMPYYAEVCKEHPEYYALVDGERDVKWGKCCVNGPHYCLTNPGVVKMFSDFANKYFDEHPEQATFPVMPGDGLRRICECPDCSAEINRNLPWETGSFSNHIWNFVNKVAREVAKKHPDKFITCAAYHQHGDCPDFPIEKNIMVLIAKRRNGYLNAEYKAYNRKRFDEWKAKVGGRLICWDYYLDADVPWRNLPVQFTKLIAEDIQYMKSVGVKGEFVECPFPTKGNVSFVGMMHLNLYVTSQLYWNPTLDLQELLDEYYELFYGPARDQMKEFWETAEACRDAAGPKHLTASPGSIRNYMSPVEVFSAEVLRRMIAVLNDAVRVTPADSVYRKRVELIKNEFDLGSAALVAMLDMKSRTMTIGSEFGRFDEFQSRTGNPFEVKTSFAAAADKENLILKFVCYEPNMSKLNRDKYPKDSAKIWNRDGMEIFIVPDPEILDHAYQLYVTPGGSVWDCERRSNRIISAYDINAKTEVQAEDDRWLLTVTIPRKDISLTQNRTFWVEFYRYRYFGDIAKDEVHSCWSPTGDSNHFCPEKFGKISFGEPVAAEKDGGHVIVRPKQPEDIVNGTQDMLVWKPGGVGGNMPLVGFVNGTKRNDMVLLKLELGDFAWKGSVDKAVLSMNCSVFGDKSKACSCSFAVVESIDSRLLRTEMGIKDLTPFGYIGIAAGTNGKEMTFDVTEPVNAALAKGQTYIKFRFRDAAADDVNAQLGVARAIYLKDIRLVVNP